MNEQKKADADDKAPSHHYNWGLCDAPTVRRHEKFYIKHIKGSMQPKQTARLLFRAGVALLGRTCARACVCMYSMCACIARIRIKWRARHTTAFFAHKTRTVLLWSSGSVRSCVALRAEWPRHDIRRDTNERFGDQPKINAECTCLRIFEFAKRQRARAGIPSIHEENNRNGVTL